MKFFDFDKLLDTLTNYLETKLEIFKIDIKEEIGAIIAKVVVYLFMAILAIVALIFALSTFGSWMNEILDSSYLGYLIDFGILLIALVLVYLNRDKLAQYISLKLKKEEKEELTNE